MPEVERSVAVVRGRHRPVQGFSHRGTAYDAADPALDAWVHNSLTDSFLTAYRAYGARGCGTIEADRYVAEQTRVGRLLGADPLPETSADLTRWITDHPALEASPGSRQAVRFLRCPPLPVSVRPAYGILFHAAVATLPDRIRSIVGVHGHPGNIKAGRIAVAALRWALGPSPDWQLALFRTGTPPPPDVHFLRPARRPIPEDSGPDDPGPGDPRATSRMGAPR
jgi:uncharacterized protein (DUF2236 family)